MYCQACGAENTKDARFCNMCGARFAQAGEAGGPIGDGGEPETPAPAGGPRNDPNATVLGVGKAEVGSAAPPAGAAAPTAAARGAGARVSGPQQSPFGGDSMLGVTLGGIGVKSAKKTWLTIFAIAATLVAVGSLATWLAMRGSDEGGGHAEADDPFVLGTPLTEETEGVPEESGEGDPTPEDIDFVTGGGGSTTTAAGSSSGSTMRSTSRRSTMRGSSSGSSTGGTTTMSSGGSTGSSTGGSTTTTMSSTGSTGGSTTMESTGGSTGGSTTMDSAGGSGTETGGTGTGGGSETGGGGSLPTDTETAPEERNLELELYGSRVRYVVRRYYAARAQNCFDRATRNDPSVSGTVVVAMTIGEDGQVSRSRVQRNTTGNESLGSCLSNNVSTWRLPPPPGGSLDMTMPFSR